MSTPISPLSAPIIVSGPIQDTSISSPKATGPISVVLREHQKNTFDKVLTHSLSRSFHFNTSPTGTGKTPFLIKLAQRFGYFMIITGPASIEPNWNKECRKYNQPYIFISLNKLGRINAAVQYVTFDENGDATVTQLFMDLLKNPVYFVIDEAQGTKNDDSNCTNACYAMAAAIRKLNNGSRMACLSATQFDKEEQIETAFKMMGVMTAKDLFKYELGNRRYLIDGYGYSQIVEYCRKLDPVTTNILELSPSEYTAKKIRYAVYCMFVQIIKPIYTFAMPLPNIPAKFIPFHINYKVTGTEFDNIKAAVRDMRAVTGFDDEGSLDPSLKIGAVNKAFAQVEYSKVGLFTRISKEKLDSDPNCKVVIYVWQDKLGTVDELLKNLAAYGPLRCDGKVNPARREQYKELFNAHDNKYRVIIAKPTAFGVGHSLDDTSPDGSFKRHFFISPYYNFEKIHQAAGRGYRATTTSDVTCTLVYVAGTEEAGIINALVAKKQVTKDVTATNDEIPNNKVIYPGEYPIYYEN